jgi:CHASE2 domain-containing sensor protein
MVVNSLKKLKFFSWDNLFATIVVFGVLQFLPILFTIDFLDPIQNTIEDFNAADIVFSQLRNYDEIVKDTNIVLVNIGYLDRKGIAKFVNILNSYNPKVIGIDSFFRNAKTEEQDSALACALRNVKNLVLVSELKHLDNDLKFDTILYSNEMFKKYATNGFSNIITDKSSGFRVIRSVSPTEVVNDSLVLFFALEVAKHLYPDKVERFIERGKEVEYVNYKRNLSNDKYTVLDIDDVLNNMDNLSFIKDKIVLMGFLGPDVNTLVFEDIFFTPMNENYLGKAFPDMYGVMIHANVISMINEEDYITTTDHIWKIIITFIIIYFNMVLFYYIETRFEDLYETANLLIIIFELFILFLVMIYVFLWFEYDIGLKEATLFGIIFSATGFELYHGSFKPIIKNNFKKLYESKIRKASDKLVDEFAYKEDKEGE